MSMQHRFLRGRGWIAGAALAAAVILLIGSGARAGQPSNAAAAAATPAVAAESDSWICPMYCTAATSEPGACSVCKMALVAASSVPPPPPRDERPPEIAAYVCSIGDGTEDVAPGACSKCGAEMVLVNRTLTAAILIFDGVQIIDYTGPAEVFGQAGLALHFVAKTADPITTSMGMRVVPGYSFADCPQTDILIIPGGGVDDVENDPEAIAWLRARGEKAQFVLSVCNGAFILAKTGLIDGRTATTFYDLIDDFETRYPKVTAVRDQRYVDNGKFITTAGISSGIDGSLHVIGKLRGRATAQRVALNMEYDWKEDARYARASFADRHLRRIFGRNLRLRIQEGVAPLVANTDGTADRWEVAWRVASDEAPGALLARLDDTVAERGPWKRRDAGGKAARGNAARSAWRFEDGGVAWTGVTEIARDGTPGRYRVRVQVERAGVAGKTGTDS
jgi:putative intracellular protease/amidase